MPWEGSANPKFMGHGFIDAATGVLLRRAVEAEGKDKQWHGGAQLVLRSVAGRER